MIDNPLDTKEMRAEIYEMNQNLQKSPINVDKVMSWILGTEYKKIFRSDKPEQAQDKLFKI
jgi:hypothetical protein